MKLDAIKVGSRFRKNLGDVAGLAKSIEEVGLLHPVVVDEGNRLIAGARRIEAFRLLGRDEIPATVVKLDEIVRGEFAENTVRLDFAPSEAVAIAEALEPREREAAEEREREGGKTAGRNRPKGSGKFSTPKGRAKDKAARVAGVSRHTLAKAKAVVDAAKEDPKFAPLVEEMDRTGRVNGVFKKLEVERQAAALNAKAPPLPEGPFDVLVVDPPWRYDAREEDASHRSANPYASMDLDAIRALPVAKLAGKNAVLWLWTTNAHLPRAFGIAEAWGFTYKTLLTWDKERIGTGDWLRGQTEHVLMCVRGKPTVTLGAQSTILRAKAGRHSEKPGAFYPLVESLCPGSRVDLFARSDRDGWTVWGHEA